MGSRDVGKDPQLCKPHGNVCFVVGTKQICGVINSYNHNLTR